MRNPIHRGGIAVWTISLLPSSELPAPHHEIFVSISGQFDELPRLDRYFPRSSYTITIPDRYNRNTNSISWITPYKRHKAGRSGPVYPQFHSSFSSYIICCAFNVFPIAFWFCCPSDLFLISNGKKQILIHNWLKIFKAKSFIFGSFRIKLGEQDMKIEKTFKIIKIYFYMGIIMMPS